MKDFKTYPFLYKIILYLRQQKKNYEREVNRDTTSSKVSSSVSFPVRFFHSTLSPVFSETTRRTGIPIRSASANFAPADTPSRSSYNTSIPVFCNFSYTSS